MEWLKEPVDCLHDGYFAQEEKGVLKDTRGDTPADGEVYSPILMKDKEQLDRVRGRRRRDPWRGPLHGLRQATRLVGGVEHKIGRDMAEAIRTSLIEQKLLDAKGRVRPAFDPKRKNFKLDLPDVYHDLIPAMVDLLAAYRIE